MKLFIIGLITIIQLNVYAKSVQTKSPDGTIIAQEEMVNDQLQWLVSMDKTIVLNPSELGIERNGIDLGKTAEIEQVEHAASAKTTLKINMPAGGGFAASFNQREVL